MSVKEQYQSLSQFYYEELGNALRISGVLLAPGIWKGTVYAVEQIKALYEKFKDHLLSMPLVVEHFRDPNYLGRVVGKHTNIKFDAKTGSILYQADVTDPEAIKDIKADRFIGTSVANWVDFIPSEDGIHAANLMPVNNSLTASPACKKCVINSVTNMSEDEKERSIAYYGMFPLSEILETLSQKPESCKCPHMDLSEAKDAQELSVIPFAAHTKADEGEAWNFGSSEYSLEQLKMACTVIVGDPKNKTSYKLPHHKTSGAVVWHGVHSAFAAIAGARGGVHMPTSDIGGAKAHLLKHYKQFDKKPSQHMNIEDFDAAMLEILSLETNLTQEVDNMSNKPNDQEPAPVVQSTPTVTTPTVTTPAVTQPVATPAVTNSVPATPPVTPQTTPVQPANVPSPGPVPATRQEPTTVVDMKLLRNMIEDVIGEKIKTMIIPPVTPPSTPPTPPAVTPAVVPASPPATPPSTPPAEPTLTRQQVVDEVVKLNRDELLDAAAGMLIKREDVEEKWE